MICLMLKPSQTFFVYHKEDKENFFTKKELFKEKGKWRIKQKKKEGFLTAFTTAIKKESAMSMRKHANELKVHAKTVRTTIKKDLTPLIMLYGVF